MIRHFELALVLVRLDHLASVIVRVVKAKRSSTESNSLLSRPARNRTRLPAIKLCGALDAHVSNSNSHRGGIVLVASHVMLCTGEFHANSTSN